MTYNLTLEPVFVPLYGTSKTACTYSFMYLTLIIVILTTKNSYYFSMLKKEYSVECGLGKLHIGHYVGALEN
jgi:hypothetical protein